MKEALASYKKEHAGVAHSEVFKVVASGWSALSVEAKASYKGTVAA